MIMHDLPTSWPAPLKQKYKNIIKHSWIISLILNIYLQWPDGKEITLFNIRLIL